MSHLEEQNKYPVKFSVSSIANEQNKEIASLTINSDFVKALYNQVVKIHKTQTSTLGFAKGETPAYYIEQNYKLPIFEHLQEFLFFHCVINSIYQEVITNKLIVVGDLDLRNVCITNDYSATFEFDFARLEPTPKQNWKNLPFKCPVRKNYKDLDKQVDNFIKEEEEFTTKFKKDAIAIGDWVCFSMNLVDNKHEKLLGDYSNILWLKIGDEEADLDTQQLFINKKIGDIFYTESIFLQQYISTQLSTSYIFEVTIIDLVPQNYFSFDLFKKHFRIRSTKEMHQKLIEVFSYRNDFSLRRETVEVLFKLLNQQFMCKLLPYLVEQQKNLILKSVHNNPDYHVYKSRPDFKQKVKQLAEKQLKQTIIIDYIAYQENITVTQQDINSYLNLMMRPRTKEFLYFCFPSTKIQDRETPVPLELLKRYCLREKTLNYVLYHLIKKNY